MTPATVGVCGLVKMTSTEELLARFPYLSLIASPRATSTPAWNDSILSARSPENCGSASPGWIRMLYGLPQAL